MKTIIATSIRDAIKTIDWLDPTDNSKAAGLVIRQTKRVKQGDTYVNITFPITNDAEGVKCYETGNYYAMLPSATYDSVSYIEANNPLLFQYEDGRKKLMYSTNVNLVIWANAKKIGVTDLNAIDRIVYQVTQALTSTAGDLGVDSGRINVTDDRVTNGVIDLKITSIETNNPTIFSAYSIAPQVEAYTYPYLYTRFQIDTRMKIGKNCLTNITVGDELC